MYMSEQLIYRDEYFRLEERLKRFSEIIATENRDAETVVVMGIDRVGPYLKPKNTKNRLKRIRRKASGK